MSFLKDNLTDILISTGILAVIVNYFFGGKQKLKNDSLDPLTRGADTSVSTMERILLKQEEMIDKANIHLDTCEEKVKELTERVQELERKAHNHNDTKTEN